MEMTDWFNWATFGVFLQRSLFPQSHLHLLLSLPLLVVLHASTSSAMSPQSRIEEAEQEQSAMQAENSRLSAELKVCAILWVPGSPLDLTPPWAPGLLQSRNSLAHRSSFSWIRFYFDRAKDFDFFWVMQAVNHPLAFKDAEPDSIVHHLDNSAMTGLHVCNVVGIPNVEDLQRNLSCVLFLPSAAASSNPHSDD